MRLLIIVLSLALLPLTALSQKKNKKNEGGVPKVTIYHVTPDSVKPLSRLNKNKENRIRVVLEGGIQNIQNTMYVTSKNADIKRDPAKPGEYILIPLEEDCEIIVDVKTHEVYYSVKEVEKKGKMVKEIVQEYPPKTYMLSYERYEVK